MSFVSISRAVFYVAVVFILSGCEEDVTAVVGTEHPFSMWGVLNPLSDTQYVRVFPIEGTLNRGEPMPLDARFVSTDLETGEEELWRDSVLVDERGIVGHVFYAPLTVDYQHTYALAITGGHGATASTEVEVPIRTTLTLVEPDTSVGVILPGLVLNNPPRLVRNELTFGASYIRGFTDGGCPLYVYRQYSVSYDDRIREREDGWWFVVNLREVHGFVETRALEDPFYLPPFGITFGFLRFDTIVANEAWNPPNGIYDPNVLVEPGTMSNVENGFGFVGAGYRLSRTWTLLNNVVEKSGFRADYESC